MPINIQLPEVGSTVYQLSDPDSGKELGAIVRLDDEYRLFNEAKNESHRAYPLTIMDDEWRNSHGDHYFTSISFLEKGQTPCRDHRIVWKSNTTLEEYVVGEDVIYNMYIKKNDFLEFNGTSKSAATSEDKFLSRYYFDEETRRMLVVFSDDADLKFDDNGKLAPKTKFYIDVDYGCEYANGDFRPVKGVTIPEP